MVFRDCLSDRCHPVYRRAFFSANQFNIAPPSSDREIRGVWITNVGSGVLFAPWGIHRALEQLAALHFNTVYPVIWNGGHTFYPSNAAKKQPEAVKLLCYQ